MTSSDFDWHAQLEACAVVMRIVCSKAQHGGCGTCAPCFEHARRMWDLLPENTPRPRRIEGAEDDVPRLRARIAELEKRDAEWAWAEDITSRTDARAKTILGAGNWDNVDHAAERVMAENKRLRNALDVVTRDLEHFADFYQRLAMGPDVHPLMKSGNEVEFINGIDEDIRAARAALAKAGGGE